MVLFPGDVQQAEVRSDEEGVRAERAVRLRDRAHHLQLLQQAIPGQSCYHQDCPIAPLLKSQDLPSPFRSTIPYERLLNKLWKLS